MSSRGGGIPAAGLKLAAVVLAASLLGPPVRATARTADPPPAAGRVVPFSPIEAMLLRSTLIAIAQANTTGEYAVLRARMDPAAAPSTAALATLFRPWREKQRDIGFAAIAEPELGHPPSIDPAGLLELAGTLPTPGFTLSFDLAFRKVTGRWRLARFTLGDGTLTIASGAPAQQSAPTAEEKPAAVAEERPAAAAPPAAEGVAAPLAPPVQPAANLMQLPPLPQSRPAF